MDPDGSSKINSSSQSQSLSVVVSAFFGNAFLTVIKFIAYFLTRSPAIFSESVHSLVDTVNQGLMFLGFKLSLRAKPSKDHPWGTYQIQYLFNFVSALIIFFIGCLVPLYVSVNSLINPEPYHFDLMDKIGIGILFLALVIESIPLIKAIKAIQTEKENESFLSYLISGRNMTVIAIFLEDTIAIAGVLVALTGQYLSYTFSSSTPDSVAGLMISVMMGLVSGFLLFNNSKFLLGHSLPEEKVDEIKQFIESMPEVEKVTKIGTEVLSVDRVYLSLEVEFHGAMIVDKDQLKEDANRIKDGENPVIVIYESNERMVRVMGSIINDIERRIRKEYPLIKSIDLEIN